LPLGASVKSEVSYEAATSQKIVSDLIIALNTPTETAPIEVTLLRVEQIAPIERTRLYHLCDLLKDSCVPTHKKLSHAISPDFTNLSFSDQRRFLFEPRTKAHNFFAALRAMNPSEDLRVMMWKTAIASLCAACTAVELLIASQNLPLVLASMNNATSDVPLAVVPPMQHVNPFASDLIPNFLASGKLAKRRVASSSSMKRKRAH
jgi:hypothetical protein